MLSDTCGKRHLIKIASPPKSGLFFGGGSFFE